MMHSTEPLAQLVTEQLVHPSLNQDDEFMFKHALTQEAVYKSLLKTQRRALHRAVAEAIEKTFPDRKAKLSDVLAYHWEQADVPDRARRYLFRAAQKAMRQYANLEALDLLGRALALCGSASPEETMALHDLRAQVYEFLSQNDQAIADYQLALPLARAAHREIDECRIMSRIAWLHSLSGRGAEAIELAYECETRARELSDESAALRAYLVQGMVAQAEGNLAYAYPRLRRALIISRASDERPLEGEALFYLGIQDNFMGRFGRAVASARRAYEIKRGLGDRVGEIVSLYLITRAQAGRGKYDEALDALESAYAISQETHNPFGLAQYSNTRAWLASELGDWQTAYELDCAGMQPARAAPVRPPEISTLINLVLDCTALGKLDMAKAYCHQVMQWMGRREFGFHAWRWQTRFADALARLHLAAGEIVQAQEQIEMLLRLTRRTQAAKYRARGLVLQARVHLARNETVAAQAFCLSARDLADALNYFPTRIESRRLLEQLGSESELVAPLVHELDQCLKHPELRRSFERGIARETV